MGLLIHKTFTTLINSWKLAQTDQQIVKIK